MTMTKGEGSETPDEGNKNLSETETQKILKSYGETIVALQKKLDALSANGQTGNATSATDIMALAEAITNKTKKELDYDEGIYEEQIPKDDYLDQKDWVRFCIPSGGYVIVDDVRKGRTVKLPFGKRMIFFEHLLTNRQQIGKHTATTPICVYVSKSKMEVEWIRNHSKYDTLIFESLAQSAGTNAEKALRLGRIMEMLRTQDFPNIVQQAKGYGIAFNENPEELKKLLAIAMCEKENEEQSNVSQKIAEEAWKSQLVLGRV